MTVTYGAGVQYYQNINDLDEYIPHNQLMGQRTSGDWQPVTRYRVGTWDETNQVWKPTGEWLDNKQGDEHYANVWSVPAGAGGTTFKPQKTIGEYQESGEGVKLSGHEDTYGIMGGERFTAEGFMGKTPREAAEEIFKTRYFNQPPEGVDQEMFLKQIEETIVKYFPTLQEVPQEELDFAESGRKQDYWELQAAAEKLGEKTQNIYGGGGGGMREKMSGQKTISQGVDVAEAGFKKDIYGLGKTQKSKWESEFKTVMEMLPDRS